METDELDDFFVDENQPIDKKIVAEIIKPFVNSIGRNGVVDYSEKFDALPSWKKIVVYLICRKAMILKGVINEERAGPKEICQNTRISEGSAKDISRHEILRKLAINERGSYSIPNHKLKKIKELLIKNE